MYTSEKHFGASKTDSMNDNLNMFGSGAQFHPSKKGQFDQTKAPRHKESQVMAGFETSIFSPHPPQRNTKQQQ